MSLRGRRRAVDRAAQELDHARAKLEQSLQDLHADSRDALTPMRIVATGFALGAVGGLLRPWATTSESMAMLGEAMRGARTLTELLNTVAKLTASTRAAAAANRTEEPAP
jgi:hypothetical protein